MNALKLFTSTLFERHIAANVDSYWPAFIIDMVFCTMLQHAFFTISLLASFLSVVRFALFLEVFLFLFIVFFLEALEDV
jgi:hypothetical protein